MPTSQLTDGAQLPNVFINVIQKKKTLHFTTLELVCFILLTDLNDQVVLIPLVASKEQPIE